MFGKEKMGIRKKAMESMMEEGPAIAIKIKSKAEAPESPEQMEKEGYESFMVTPEEKEMILSMRKQTGGDMGESEEMMEA